MILAWGARGPGSFPGREILHCSSGPLSDALHQVNL